MLWFATEMLALLGAALLLGLVVGWIVWGRTMRAHRGAHAHQLSVLHTQLASLGDEGRRTQTRFAAVAGDLDTSKLALQSSSLELQRTREAFSVSQGNLAGAESELGALRRSLASTQQLVSQADQSRAESQSVRESIEAELNRVRSRLAETHESLVSTQRSLANSDRTNQAIRSSAESDRALAAVRLAEQASHQSAQHANSQTVALARQHDDHQAELFATTQKVVYLGRALDAAADRATKAEVQLADHRRRMVAAEAKHNAVDKELRRDVLGLSQVWQQRSVAAALVLKQSLAGRLAAEKDLALLREQMATTHRMLGSQVNELDTRASNLMRELSEVGASQDRHVRSIQSKYGEQLAKREADHQLAVHHWKTDLDRRTAELALQKSHLVVAEQRVFVMEERVRVADAEVVHLRGRLRTQSEQYEQAQTLVQTMQTEHQALAGSLHQSAIGLETSHSALHDERAATAALGTEVASLRSELLTAEFELTTARQRETNAVEQAQLAATQAAESQAAASRAAAEQASVELERVSYERHLLDEELQHLRLQHAANAESKTAIDYELRHARLEVSRLAASVGAWAQLHETLDEKHHSLSTAKRVVEDELGAAQIRLATVESAHTELESMYRALETRHATVQSDFSEAQENMATSLANSLANSAELAETLNVKLVALESDRSDVQLSNAVLQSDLATLQEHLSAIRTDKDLLQSSLERLEHQNASLTSSLGMAAEQQRNTENDVRIEQQRAASERRKLEGQLDLSEAELVTASQRSADRTQRLESQLSNQQAEVRHSQEVAANWRRELEQLRLRFERRTPQRVALLLNPTPPVVDSKQKFQRANDFEEHVSSPRRARQMGSSSATSSQRLDEARPDGVASNALESTGPLRTRLRAGLVESASEVRTGAELASRHAADNLQRIEGIGPKIDAALRSAGLSSFVRIENSTPDQLRDALASSGLTFAPSLLTWSKQAAFLVVGDEAGFQAYTERLVAGREEPTR